MLDTVGGKIIQYRSGIDGLRAIAVLSVLLFHAGFGVIPGGLVGVDIFFVVSGFLITSIIIREAREGKYTYAGFYGRRIRGLLPPLIPGLAVSIILYFVLLNSSQFTGF
ncbi:O-acetyltransferase OatA [compost metagenome]